MKNRHLIMFGFILLILIGSIQFLTVFAGDPVPGIDISLDEIPDGIKVDLGGILTEHGIVIGTGTKGSDVYYAIVLDIIPLSNFQQDVQDELVVSSKNIRKNISVAKQADSQYGFYVSSPGHKTVSELTLDRSSNGTDVIGDEIAVYRLSINADDLSKEQLQNYIKTRSDAAKSIIREDEIITAYDLAEPGKSDAAEIAIKEEGVKRIPSSEKRPAVPDWIKNNAKWFSEGMISEDDFVKGLEWMINNGIIRAEHTAGGVK